LRQFLDVRSVEPLPAQYLCLTADKSLGLQYAVTMMDDIPPNETQSLGKVMVICAWILAILLMTLFFSRWSKEYQMNTKPKMVTANGIKQTLIKRNVLNQYIVEGTLNGKPVTFLLDTGATDVVIPGKIAKNLQLENGIQGTAHTAGGKVTIYGTQIDEIVIGNIALHHLKASINPAMEGNEILLGMSALKRLTFYQQGDNLVLTVTNPKSP